MVRGDGGYFDCFQAALLYLSTEVSTLRKTDPTRHELGKECLHPEHPTTSDRAAANNL